MRNFSARETEWLQELDGIELASFQRRAIAFTVDWILISIILSVIVGGGYMGYLEVEKWMGHPMPDHVNFDFRPEHTNIQLTSAHETKESRSEALHLLSDLIVPVMYFGLFTWKGRGRSPGKRVMKIRVVSLVHRHLSLWHSIERALGYAAAALEAGFGFIQFFIHPYRRCVQDRIAETIVVTERSYLALQHRLDHPLLPDSGMQPEARLADETPV